jgi:hypothetical protein
MQPLLRNYLSSVATAKAAAAAEETRTRTAVKGAVARGILNSEESPAATLTPTAAITVTNIPDQKSYSKFDRSRHSNTTNSINSSNRNNSRDLSAAAISLQLFA